MPDNTNVRAAKQLLFLLNLYETCKSRALRDGSHSALLSL